MDGSLYYVHSDLLGSTVAVSDAAGGEVGRVQYDPYGEVITSTLPVDLTDQLFTGARFDGTIGLYQMGARWYDPALGRWIQADTIVPEPGEPQAWNRYAYVYNNPLKYVDPSGHQPPPPRQLISLEFGRVVFEVVEFAPGTSGVQKMEKWQHNLGTLAHGAGLALEVAEMLAIVGTPMVEHPVAFADVVAEFLGSYGHGETYKGQPHLSLPEMRVVGQDVLVSGFDFGLALLANAIGTPAGGKVVDALTTGFSMYWDVRRLAGEEIPILSAIVDEMPTVGAIGFYQDEEGRVHIVVLEYPISEEEEGSSHH